MRRYLALLTMVNIADTWATIWLANRIGWRYEGNPWMRWSFQNLGTWPAGTIKILGPLLLAAIMYRVSKEARATWFPWVWLLGFTFVAAFNVGGVIAIGW